jgi:amidohydrolase
LSGIDSATALTRAPTLQVDLSKLRRRLHRLPEVGLQLPQTQTQVLSALADLGLEISTGTETTSVTAVLRGTGPRSSDRIAVLLRGDMDALPLIEESGEEFASTNGAMHACGHDLHTAGLVGAARILSSQRDRLNGDVVFMFQPGEEGFDGAAVMIKEGVLDAAGSRVAAAYGLHVMSGLLPRGTFATRPGPLMAASSGLFVTVIGTGGHASRPADAADPIVVAAELVTSLQTMITRKTDVFDPVVLTVGTFHAGTRRNIIPSSATFEATVRTFSPRALETVRASSVQLCRQIAEAHGMVADVRFEEEYPVTSNSDEHAQFALDSAADLFGSERAWLLPFPLMGSEDFSRVLAEVPGAFAFLGASPADWTTAPSNHSALARFDDSVLPDAALLLAQLARGELDRLTAA